MNAPKCRLCNHEHWPRMGCKWPNVAAQETANNGNDVWLPVHPSAGQDNEIARLKRDVATANRKVSERDATIADLQARVDALTLALSTPVDAPSTASTPGIDAPSTSTAGVYASTSTPSTSTVDTPSDKDRERKREWARKDRERRRLEAQRTKP